MMSLTSMWTCHWARRRLQRYLDADPAAPLTADELHRIEGHLATCDRCTALAEEYRGLRRALVSWSARRAPDPAALARLRLSAERLIGQDAP
jgi:anti-sigma factor RsiW